MNKKLIVGLISGVMSMGAYAAACTATATTSAAAGAAGSATAPASGENCLCDGGAAQKTAVNGGKGTSIATPLFMKTGFDVQCSANTIVSYNEVSGVAFAVASGSKKGNQSFQGSSAGGGVAKSGDCTAAGCIGTDVTTALTAAVTASSL